MNFIRAGFLFDIRAGQIIRYRATATIRRVATAYKAIHCLKGAGGGLQNQREFSSKIVRKIK